MNKAIEESRVDSELRGMTPRVQKLFNVIEARMHKKQIAWGGDLSVLNEESLQRSTVIRRSLAVETVLTQMPIDIEEADLIVGNSTLDGTIVRCMLPILLKKEELGTCSIQFNHKCPDYETLLHKGLRGLIHDIKAQVDVVSKLNDSKDKQLKMDTLEAMQIEAESVIQMANRYADLAETKAGNEPDEQRKAELLEIARVCRRVPEFPAESLHEAVQSVWFVNYALFETMSYLSIGRIDQLLNPYFENDYKHGRITLRQAQELIDCFCLRVNDRAQIDPKNYVVDQTKLKGAPQQSRIYYGNGFVTEPETDGADAINHWGQNILISGLTADRTDGTNALTYMFLNAHEKFSMTSPVLTVRMHKNSPKELFERVAEVLKTGGGMPYVNNDDIIITGYENMGMPYEDACEYANSNCWETLIQGRSNQEMIRGINFLYYLELALNRGKSFVYADAVSKMKKPDPENPLSFGAVATPGNKTVDGIDTGDITNFRDFDDLMNAWKAQMDFMLKVTTESIAKEVRENRSQGPNSSNSLLSILMRDCIEKATDLSHRGSRYDIWHLMGEAVSNAADAAAAIKKMVFIDKKLTLTELVEILKNNWDSPQGEELRLRLINNVPKFGNDNDFVDEIATEMVDYFIERGQHHTKPYPDILFPPCIGTFSWVISIGKRIGASADGRKTKEAIAANMSPVQGRDVSGPTSAINSYMKLNTAPMAAGAPIDLRLSMNGLQGDKGTKRISGIIETFIEMGGNMMTLTITSVEDLKRAMVEPEKYRGLRVRMGGWSAYFVLLSKESQQMHLRRVEHGLA